MSAAEAPHVSFVPVLDSEASSSLSSSSRPTFFTTTPAAGAANHEHEHEHHDHHDHPVDAASPRSPAPVILSPAGLKPCVICFDKEKDGVQCSENHFLCRGCLQGFIRNLEPVTIRRSGGCVSCPAIHEGGNGEACPADPWSFVDLITLLDPTTQRMYVQRLEGLLRSVLESETALTGKLPPSPYRSASLHATGRRSRSVSPLPPTSSSSSSSLSELPAEHKLATYRQYVAEGILTLKCPREGCRRAFLDFDGCFALTCPGCGCGFCAACIVDCGDDAHTHCKEVHQGLFGSLARFNEIQRHRRLVAIVQYLASLEETPALLDQLLLDESPLGKDLKEVGLSGNEVKRVLADGLSVLGRQETRIGTEEADAPAHEPVVRLQAEEDEGTVRFPRLRRLLDGPGYPAEDDSISWVLGTVVTASIMGAAVWALTDLGGQTTATSESELYGIPATQFFTGLIVGPSLLMLLSGRGKQLFQAVYGALLTAVLGIPLYFLSGPVLSCVIMVVVWALSLAAHGVGILLDVSLEGARFLQGLVDGASAELVTLREYAAYALDWGGNVPGQSMPVV